MQVEKPGYVRVTLSCTMTVDQWDLISKALTENLAAHYCHDVSALRNAIDEATRRIQKSVSGDSIPIKDEP